MRYESTEDDGAVDGLSPFTTEPGDSRANRVSPTFWFLVSFVVFVLGVSESFLRLGGLAWG